MPATPHGEHDTASLDNGNGTTQGPKGPQPPLTRKEAFTRMKTEHLLSYLDLHATIPEAYLAPTQALIEQGRKLHDAIILSTGIERKEGDPLQERGDTIIASLESLSTGAKELQKHASFMIRASREQQEAYAGRPPSLGEEYGIKTEFSEYDISCDILSESLAKKFRDTARTILTHRGTFPPEAQEAFSQIIAACEPHMNDIEAISARLSQARTDHSRACTEEENAFTNGPPASFVNRLFLSKEPTTAEKDRLDATKQAYIDAAPQLKEQAGGIRDLIAGFKARTEKEGSSPEEERFLEAHRPAFLATLRQLSRAVMIFNDTSEKLEHHLSSSLQRLGPYDKRLALQAFHDTYHAQKQEISNQFTETIRTFGYLHDDAPHSYLEAYSGFTKALDRKLDGLDNSFSDLTKALESIPPERPAHSR